MVRWRCADTGRHCTLCEAHLAPICILVFLSSSYAHAQAMREARSLAVVPVNMLFGTIQSRWQLLCEVRQARKVAMKSRRCAVVLLASADSARNCLLCRLRCSMSIVQLTYPRLSQICGPGTLSG